MLIVPQDIFVSTINGIVDTLTLTHLVDNDPSNLLILQYPGHVQQSLHQSTSRAVLAHPTGILIYWLPLC